jgi:hypothetical protein
MGLHGLCKTRLSPPITHGYWRILVCFYLLPFAPKYQSYRYHSVTGKFPCIYAAPGQQNPCDYRKRLYFSRLPGRICPQTRSHESGIGEPITARSRTRPGANVRAHFMAGAGCPNRTPVKGGY